MEVVRTKIIDQQLNPVSSFQDVLRDEVIIDCLFVLLSSFDVLYEFLAVACFVDVHKNAVFCHLVWATSEIVRDVDDLMIFVCVHLLFWNVVWTIVQYHFVDVETPFACYDDMRKMSREKDVRA